MRIPYKKICQISKRDYLLNFCTGKRVLHLGCTDWPITAEKARAGKLLHVDLENVCNVVGLDYSQDGLKALGNYSSSHLLQCDLTEDCLGLAEQLGTFDVVLLCDVLEHLDNFNAAINNIKLFMAMTSRLVITVPNSFSISKLLYILFRNEEKQHPEHTCSFSVGNLQQLMARYSLAVASCHGFPYYGSEEGAVRVKKWLHRLLRVINRNGLSDELLVEAKLSVASHVPAVGDGSSTVI